MIGLGIGNAETMMTGPGKVYRGIPEQGPEDQAGRVVRAEGEFVVGDLPLRLDLRNHSPTGFAWGYEGSGPAQLALAMLADATCSDRTALRLYQRFKTERIAKLKPGPWEIVVSDVTAWAAMAIEGEDEPC